MFIDRELLSLLWFFLTTLLNEWFKDLLIAQLVNATYWYNAVAFYSHRSEGVFGAQNQTIIVIGKKQYIRVTGMSLYQNPPNVMSCLSLESTPWVNSLSRQPVPNVLESKNRFSLPPSPDLFTGDDEKTGRWTKLKLPQCRMKVN